MAKSPDAFRTISEVADWLGVQAHVLRFWESKFSQVKPIKRAGGRRYYRPNDMLLLGGIKQLLHEDGLTIKGVQKILREEGISHVVALSPPLDEATEAQAEEDLVEATPISQEAEEARGVVLNFDKRAEGEEAAAEPEQPEEEPAPEPETPPSPPRESPTAPPVEEPGDAPGETPPAPPPERPVTEPEEKPAEAPPVEEPDRKPPEAPEPPPQEAPIPTESPADLPPSEIPSAPPSEIPSAPPQELTAKAETPLEKSTELPAFLRHPLQEPEEADPASDEVEPVETDAAPRPEPEPRPRARRIDLPRFPAEADIDVAPGALSAAYRLRTLDRGTADQIAPLLSRLSSLRDSMAARRGKGQQPGSKD